MISKLYRHFKNDLLFQNSLYLMLASGVLAGFGFVFWLIAAHTFRAEEVGLATTLVSSMSLLAFISLIGFDNVFIRYLPKYRQKNDQVNTGLLLVTVASLVVSTLFVLTLPHFAPKLQLLIHGFWPSVLFVFFCIIASLNVLTDAYFMAQRKAKYTLIINLVFSIIKVGAIFLPFTDSAFRIFIAAGVAQTAGTLLSLGAMVWKFDYKPRLTISKTVVRDVKKYTSVVYLSSLIYFLPQTTLPIIIANRLGAAKAAYFYIVFTMANLLYTVSIATARSLMAEGSHDEADLVRHITRAFRVVLALMVPAVMIVVVFSRQILGIFGPDYADGGAALLRLMVVSGIFISVYGIGGSIFRVKHNLVSMLITNTVNALSILALTFALLGYGLKGVGIAWLVGQLVSMLVSLYLSYRIGSPLHESLMGIGRKLPLRKPAVPIS